MSNTYLVKTNCPCGGRCRCSHTNEIDDKQTSVKTAQYPPNRYVQYRGADGRVHYGQPQTLHGTDAHGNRYVSHDQGRSWQLVKSYPAAAPQNKPTPRQTKPTTDQKYASPTGLGQRHVAPKHLDQRFEYWIQKMLDEPTYDNFAKTNGFPSRVHFPKTDLIWQRNWWMRLHVHQKNTIWHFVVSSEHYRSMDRNFHWWIEQMLNEAPYYDGFADMNGFPKTVDFPKPVNKQKEWWDQLNNQQKAKIEKFVFFWHNDGDRIRERDQRQERRNHYVPVDV